MRFKESESSDFARSESANALLSESANVLFIGMISAKPIPTIDAKRLALFFINIFLPSYDSQGSGSMPRTTAHGSAALELHSDAGLFRSSGHMLSNASHVLHNIVMCA